jgi:hypothetical protein
MDQGGSIKIAYRDVAMRRSDGRATQEQLAGSRQIFSDFVQVQTVFFVIHDFRAVCMKFMINFISRYRLHAICGLTP